MIYIDKKIIKYLKKEAKEHYNEGGSDSYVYLLGSKKIKGKYIIKSSLKLNRSGGCSIMASVEEKTLSIALLEMIKNGYHPYSIARLSWCLDDERIEGDRGDSLFELSARFPNFNMLTVSYECNPDGGKWNNEFNIYFETIEFPEIEVYCDYYEKYSTISTECITHRGCHNCFRAERPEWKEV